MRYLALAALLVIGSCAPQPAPQPVPSPTPTATPAPTPTPTPVDVCAPDPPALNRLNLKVHVVGPSWTTLDVTPQVRDAEFCTAIGFPGNLYCALGVEGNSCRSVRERKAMGGDPVWSGPGEVSPEGPYLYRVKYNVSGDVKVCNVAGTVCATLHVSAR